jgi:beta-N-acetylhexosaminidase
LFATDPAAALRAAWLTGALIGSDCRAAGFTVAAAPVLDISVPGTHDVIGDRALAAHPVTVARLGRAIANGLLAAGVLPVGKHVPGHGRVRVDSHLALPKVTDADLSADFRPFTLNADLPWMMTAHIVYDAIDPHLPATLSARVIETVVRGRIGFKGVLVTDDLAMKALSGAPADLAVQSLAAGCDIALYCSGDFALTEALLRACPPVAPRAGHRLRVGREAAAGRRLTLDPARLQAERDRLLT